MKKSYEEFQKEKEDNVSEETKMKMRNPAVVRQILTKLDEYCQPKTWFRCLGKMDKMITVCYSSRQSLLTKRLGWNDNRDYRK